MPIDFTHKLVLKDEKGERTPVLHYLSFEEWLVMYLDGKLLHAWKYEDWPALLEAMGFEVKYADSEDRPLYEPPNSINPDLHADTAIKLCSEPSEEEEEPDLWPHSALLGG